MALAQNNKTSSFVAVWDLPLRLFHWLLVIAVFGAIGSAKSGQQFWHERFGLLVLGLVLFRLLWGIFGLKHARFASFVRGPSALIGYIRDRMAGGRSYQPGHSPSGGWAVVAMLLVLLLMAVLGTMSNDDILYEGPLAALVPQLTDEFSRWHHRLQFLVFLLVVLHLLAILIYKKVLGIGLTKAMVTGRATVDSQRRSPVTETQQFSWSHQLVGLILLGLCILATQALSLVSPDRLF